MVRLARCFRRRQERLRRSAPAGTFIAVARADAGFAATRSTGRFASFAPGGQGVI